MNMLHFKSRDRRAGRPALPASTDGRGNACLCALAQRPAREEHHLARKPPAKHCNYFRPSMQALIRFLSEKRLRQRAEELTGYDPSPAGQIRFAA
jgi:hypothetical protein